MKLKGRILALTMALMLVISSFGGIAFADNSVTVYVNDVTLNADGKAEISASFSGFPANYTGGQAKLTNGTKSVTANLAVDASGNAVHNCAIALPAGSYKIIALDASGNNRGSASFVVHAGEVSAQDNSAAQSEDSNLLTQEAPELPKAGAEDPKPELTASWNFAEKDGETIILITAKVENVPENIRVARFVFNDHNNELQEFTSAQATLTDNFELEAKPGSLNIKVYMKETTDAAAESLECTIDIAPSVTKITSGKTYTIGENYTLKWEAKKDFAAGTEIKYEIAYKDKNSEWVKLGESNTLEYPISSEILATNGSEYAVRAICGEFESNWVSIKLAGQYSEEDVTISVDDVKLVGGEGYAKITVSAPNDAKITKVIISSKTLGKSHEQLAKLVEGTAATYTAKVTAPADDYVATVSLQVNGATKTYTKGFKVSHTVTATVDHDTDYKTLTVEFDDKLPTTTTQVCINVAGSKHHFTYTPGNNTFVLYAENTDTKLVEPLLDTPGKHSINVTYQVDGSWPKATISGDTSVEIDLAHPSINSAKKYTTNTAYTLTWNGPIYAEGVKVTYEIKLGETVVAADIAENSYTIPASYFAGAEDITFTLYAVCGELKTSGTSITLTNSVNLKAPTLIGALSGKTEIAHTAGLDLNVSWNPVTNAEGYIVKLNDTVITKTATPTTIVLGNYFEDGKAYTLSVAAYNSDNVVGKATSITVKVGEQPLKTPEFKVLTNPVVVDAEGKTSVSLSATNCDTRIKHIRLNDTTFNVADFANMEVKFTFVAAGTLTIKAAQSTDGTTWQDLEDIKVEAIAEADKPAITLSANEVSLTKDVIKVTVTVYNLPETAKQICVNVDGDKKFIAVTSDMTSSASFELELDSATYTKLAVAGKHDIRLTYTDGSAWPNIGSAVFTVKPAAPVLPAAEATIAKGDNYTLTWTDAINNTVTYDYAIWDAAGEKWGEWKDAGSAKSLPIDIPEAAAEMIIGLRAAAGSVHSDIAQIKLTIKPLSATLDPDPIYISGNSASSKLTLSGIPNKYRGETLSLYLSGTSTALSTATVAEDGTATFTISLFMASAGTYQYTVKAADETLISDTFNVAPPSPTILDPVKFVTYLNVGDSLRVLWTSVANIEGYYIEMLNNNGDTPISFSLKNTITSFTLPSSFFKDNSVYTLKLYTYILDAEGNKVYSEPDIVALILGNGAGSGTGGGTTPDDGTIPGGDSVAGDYTYTTSGTVATITGYKGTNGNIILPTTLGGYRVIGIANGAFKDNAILNTVSIPSSITAIGASAFQGASNLVSVTGMEGVTSIGAYAFADTALNSFTVPSGITGLPEGVLSGTSITEIAIPAGLQSIGAYAFKDCSKLVTFRGVSGAGSYALSSIGSGAFSGCTGLTSIYIPAGVSSISSNFVDGCSNLAKFEVSSGNADFLSYNDVLFTRSTSTTLLRYPPAKSDITALNLNQVTGATVTGIASGAFSGSRHLVSVILPSTVTSISASAFQNSSITTVSIPASVTSIGTGAFQGSKLTSVIIPSSVKAIGTRAFQSCENLTSVSIASGATQIGSYAFYNCSKLTEIDVPLSVTYIGDYAFGKCSSLEKAVVPDSVTTVATGAFSNANKNLRIWCIENSAAYVYAKENNIATYIMDHEPRLSTDVEIGTNLISTYRAGVGPTFEILSNVDWTVDTTAEWLTVFNKSADTTGATAKRTITGNASATIGTMFTQNDYTAAREGDINITWDDKNGVQQKLTIHVYQEGKSEALSTMIVVNPDSGIQQKLVDGTMYLTNISAGTTVDKLSKSLNDGLATFVVSDANGGTLSSGANVTTGSVIAMVDANGITIDSAVVIVKGDINRNGNLDLIDVTMTINAYLGKIIFKDDQTLAADFTGDSSLNLLDTTQMINAYLK
ncbi:MAG: hypothetical protein E7335_05370 [Clostridiales bacterium]|nr:hypothetical protein [Clostridiales bacterium]